MNTTTAVETNPGKESTEVAEAIKALQAQLADLRKIVQAAKVSDDAAIKPKLQQ